MCRYKPVKYILNTRSKKSIFFFLYRKVCKRPASTGTFFSIHAPCKGRQVCKIGMPHKLTFQSTPCVRATSGDYLVNRRTAVVNPTAKACFCQSSHSATGLLILVSVFSPLDFSRIVCYHRFSSVSALRWVVSAVFGRRGTYSLIFFHPKLA